MSPTSDSYDVQAQGKWAFEGKLEDLSDILLPMKSAFAPNTLETTFLYNDQTKKKGYYGFPLKQQSMHVQIWQDMLEQAGFKQSDIPTKWEDYWSFWCDKVQPAIRKATGQRIYAVGQPMGVESTDFFQSFYTFMDAYNVKLVDDDGKQLAVVVDELDVISIHEAVEQLEEVHQFHAHRLADGVNALAVRGLRMAGCTLSHQNDQ